MNILLTGGLCFIGSHVASVLVSKGYNPILLDNLCNSQLETVERLKQIAGKKLVFCNADVRDTNAVRQILKAADQCGDAFCGTQVSSRI